MKKMGVIGLVILAVGVGAVSSGCFSYKAKEPLVRIDRDDEVDRKPLPEDRTECQRQLRSARRENTSLRRRVENLEKKLNKSERKRDEAERKYNRLKDAMDD